MTYGLFSVFIAYVCIRHDVKLDGIKKDENYRNIGDIIDEMSVNYLKVCVDDCRFIMINNNNKIICLDIYPNITNHTLIGFIHSIIANKTKPLMMAVKTSTNNFRLTFIKESSNSVC